MKNYWYMRVIQLVLMLALMICIVYWPRHAVIVGFAAGWNSARIDQWSRARPHPKPTGEET